MSIEHDIIERLQDLPLDKQQEVLDFTEFLRQRVHTTPARRSIIGALTDLDVHVSKGDIDDVRREMW